ncbi:Cof-type HAD-IIB family hydrolase [Bacillus sp. MRMR6]|uniref:Cof-type HAD-IIB family hydrolase n=1 Tax=Bacillus sp. MRMR6 TaxID=1928617 RepID=UPI000952BA42|nr:Cof-type HAD-IIB family hydrolase [Bacillus sp. MRMR6]OLS36915.1 phosphoglycolate phosphatase, TA0175-type [Bacillus sp. MRMR6]
MELNTNDVDIKLIALDMDGTLLNEKHLVSEANRRAIQEAQDLGVHVVLSTGRSLRTCKEHADSLRLTSYLVTVNGSEIWDEKRELVERNTVNSELVQWMWELTKKHQTKYWAISPQGNWFDEMPDDLHDKEWLKFCFNTRDDEIREKIMHALHTKGEFEITNSSPRNIEVNAAGINKEKGLGIVCKRLGISMGNVMSVGDSLNDLAMIKAAGLGIAMGNAQSIVKESADWITATNREDGVALAIRKWVLN